MPTKKAMKFPEAKIQTDIVQYLQLMKIYCIHIPNERKCTPQAMGRLVAMGLKKGAADLEVWYPTNYAQRAEVYHRMALGGEPIPGSITIGYIEVKAPKGVQSEWQKKFQARCKVAGFRYDLAYSLEDVEKLIKKYGVR